MNSFGYDYYTQNESLYFDESTYAEQIKPLDKIENFSNEIDSILENDYTKEQDILQKLCNQKDQYCNFLNKKYKDCMLHIQQKNFELNYSNNHTLLLYVLLIFAIVFIFYQRLNINSLNQLIYIMKWNMKTSPLEKKA